MKKRNGVINFVIDKTLMIQIEKRLDDCAPERRKVFVSELIFVVHANTTCSRSEHLKSYVWNLNALEEHIIGAGTIINHIKVIANNNNRKWILFWPRTITMRFDANSDNVHQNRYQLRQPQHPVHQTMNRVSVN